MKPIFFLALCGLSFVHSQSIFPNFRPRQRQDRQLDFGGPPRSFPSSFVPAPRAPLPPAAPALHVNPFLRSNNIEAPSTSYDASTAAAAPVSGYDAAVAEAAPVVEAAEAPVAGYDAATAEAAPVVDVAPISSYDAASAEAAPVASYIDEAPVLTSYGVQEEYEELERSASEIDQVVNGDPLDMLRAALPGNPGQDYPIYATAPETSFTCDDKVPGGYYADPEAECQAFHICGPDIDGSLLKYTFLCPNGTIFNQDYFICDNWFNVACDQAETLGYERNQELLEAREEATNLARSRKSSGAPLTPRGAASRRVVRKVKRRKSDVDLEEDEYNPDLSIYSRF